MSLETHIKAWDTKSTQEISKIYIRYYEQAQFISTLLELMNDPQLEAGASWLFKHAIDESDLVADSIEPSDLDNLFTTATRFSNWQAQLHILQIIDQLPISTRSIKPVQRLIDSGFKSPNKFVRAWSYSALHALASQHPTYRNRAQRLFDQALNTPDQPASIKARVRKTIKLGFPSQSDTQ